MVTTTARPSSFYRNMLRLALPIVIQNLITTAVSSADVIMLGWVSQTALSAGSLASQIMFILNLVYSGISLGIGMRLSIPVSFFFFVMACFFPQVLMMIFTSEQELIRAGIPYLRIVGVSYLFMSISQVYLCTMRSIERVVFATFTNASALLLNILLNAVFIFGLLGAPRMGIMGVALATTIARGVELLLCMADASRFCKITFLGGLVGGLLIFLLRPVFMEMADLSQVAKGYLSIMLYINMYYVLGQAMNTTVICGVFRSGGDSRWGFICDVIDMWLFSLPLGFFSAFVLKLPPMVVYFLICLDEFVKMPFIYRHYKSYRWLKDITREF